MLNNITEIQIYLLLAFVVEFGLGCGVRFSIDFFKAEHYRQPQKIHQTLKKNLQVIIETVNLYKYTYRR